MTIIKLFFILDDLIIRDKKIRFNLQNYPLLSIEER